MLVNDFAFWSDLGMQKLPDRLRTPFLCCTNGDLVEHCDSGFYSSTSSKAEKLPGYFILMFVQSRDTGKEMVDRGVWKELSKDGSTFHLNSMSWIQLFFMFVRFTQASAWAFWLSLWIQPPLLERPLAMICAACGKHAFSKHTMYPATLSNNSRRQITVT